MSETKIDDGGPAFPVLREHAFSGEILGTRGGMSLRDWFAGQIAPAALGDDCLLLAIKRIAGEEAKLTELMAKFSYEMADAMLAARSLPNRKQEG